MQYVLKYGGEEWWTEIPDIERNRNFLIEQECGRFLSHLGVTAPYSNPQYARIVVNSVTIKDGKLVQGHPLYYDVSIPSARMTDEEYRAEMDDILAPLPKAFRSYVESEAYDRGHSSGMEEVVNIARGIAFNLLPFIRLYDKERSECTD